MATQTHLIQSDNSRIERAIEELYAAGLELEGVRSRKAMSRACVHRIDAIMSDLRAAARGKTRGSQS